MRAIPHTNRPKHTDFWVGRGTSTIVRVHGNLRPVHLRGRERSEWIVR